MATRSVSNTPVNANANALSSLGTAKPGETNKAAQSKAPVAAAAAGAAGGSDGKKNAALAAGVAISSGGKERADAMQKAYDIAKNTPDVREDRVAALKAQIANGTYKVDAGNIADGMMREAIREHLAENEGR